MAGKQQQDPPTTSAPPPIFEVLTRNALGRETVHRGRHADADAARAAVEDAGVDRGQVVTVAQVSS